MRNKRGETVMVESKPRGKTNLFDFVLSLDVFSLSKHLIKKLCQFSVISSKGFSFKTRF